MKKQKRGSRLLLVAALLLTITAILCLIPTRYVYTQTLPEIVPTKPIEKLTPAMPQVLLDIAKCEGVKQFNDDGSVVRGVLNPLDVGKWQINEHYWLEPSRRLGFDIYTEEGNAAMALWLYNHFDVSPWSWSAHCHGHYKN